MIEFYKYLIRIENESFNCKHIHFLDSFYKELEQRKETINLTQLFLDIKKYIAYYSKDDKHIIPVAHLADVLNIGKRTKAKGAVSGKNIVNLKNHVLQLEEAGTELHKERKQEAYTQKELYDYMTVNYNYSKSSAAFNLMITRNETTYKLWMTDNSIEIPFLREFITPFKKWNKETASAN